MRQAKPRRPRNHGYHSVGFLNFVAGTRFGSWEARRAPFLIGLVKSAASRSTRDVLRFPGVRTPMRLPRCAFTSRMPSARSLVADDCSSIVGIEPGLSRAADDATVNMGALSAGECAESTSRMLEALQVDGESPQSMALAKLSATESHGWPQHLTAMHKAICAELLTCNGEASQVSDQRIKTEGTKRREAYYAARINYAPLKVDVPTTKRILVRVHEEAPVGIAALNQVIREEIAAMAELFEEEEVSSRDIRRALLDNGVLSVSDDGGTQVAIPTMATWAEAGPRSTGDPDP